MKHPPAISTDSNLVAKAISGDEAACEEILGAYRDSLMALAQRLLRNREDAADAVQETLLKALRALPEFDTERPLGPWLCRICTNCCVDLARNRSRKPAALEGNEANIADEGASVEESVGAAVLRGEIVAALERMPVRYRRILFMRHFQHKDVNQIAAELHKPEGTVKSWLFRARAMLRKEMAIGFR
ncbi:MAG TPA: sigma-70 family RNA polymerase sigma factor [Fimbriimonadaceae bacterium]|nr:sigma-70 family RNA polymerase sigma factor [Fimbriimonadaceae bacterium]